VAHRSGNHPRQQQQRISAVADHRHKRDTNARMFNLHLPRARYVAGPIALVATLSTVGAGVVAASPDTRDLLASSGSTGTSDTTDATSGAASVDVDLSGRAPIVSRSGDRIEKISALDRMLTEQATSRAVRQADTKVWTTAPLNLWTSPVGDAEQVGLLKNGKKVLVTGRRAADRVEVVMDGDALWVTAGYLTEDKPEPEREDEATADSASEEATLGGACTNGTAVDGQPNVIAVHQAVCAAFPELTSYGTYRGDGEHAQGLAIDIMVSGSAGWEVAEFIRANYAELGVNYVMYSQKIWSVDRAGEGWRYVEDRGSATANHYDHVHVTTY
jgi:hypothetical protein